MKTMVVITIDLSLMIEIFTPQNFVMINNENIHPFNSKEIHIRNYIRLIISDKFDI